MSPQQTRKIRNKVGNWMPDMKRTAVKRAHRTERQRILQSVLDVGGYSVLGEDCVRIESLEEVGRQDFEAGKKRRKVTTKTRREAEARQF